jgi:hypothetical protein
MRPEPLQFVHSSVPPQSRQWCVVILLMCSPPRLVVMSVDLQSSVHLDVSVSCVHGCEFAGMSSWV